MASQLEVALVVALREVEGKGKGKGEGEDGGGGWRRNRRAGEAGDGVYILELKGAG